MEQKNEKIMGLAFRAIDHRHRETLVRWHIETAADLAKVTDTRLTEMGLPKNAISQLRKVQKSLGFENASPKQNVRKVLVKMNANSVIDYGKFAGQTVNALLEAKKTRSLRWLYYNVSYVDFTDDVKEQIKLTHIIPKPGVNKEMHDLNNSELEANIHGKLKLKIKMQVSKTLRIQEELKRKARAKEFTKGKMQWANHGHGKLKISADFDPVGDMMFEKEIRKAGYNLPKAPKAKPVKINFEKLYREFLSSVPDRIPEENRMFLANVLFKDYVRTTCPSSEKEVEAFLYKDFICPSYFETLEKLDLDYGDLNYLLTHRQPFFKHVIVSNPLTGEKFYLKNYGIETETRGMEKVLVLFNDETFRRTPLTDAFRDYRDEPVSEAGTEDSRIVRLGHIEETILKKMSEGGMAEAMSARKRKSNCGRSPKNFNFKVKNGKLFIRLHNEKGPSLYEEFFHWIEKNIPATATLLTAVASGIEPFSFPTEK